MSSDETLRIAQVCMLPLHQSTGPAAAIVEPCCIQPKLHTVESDDQAEARKFDSAAKKTGAFLTVTWYKSKLV